MSLRVIRAGAGAGKTRRLTAHLLDELTSGRLRPEGVLATTFTNAAANELAARVRRGLLAAGREDLAATLGRARIGTVHSVCARLLRETALDVGASPRVEVLPPESASGRFRSAVSRVVTERERARLEAISARAYDLNWVDVVQRIADAAASQGADEAALERAAEESWAGLRDCLPAARDDLDEVALGAALGSVLEEAVDTRVGREAQARVERVRARLSSGRRPRWQDLAALVNLDGGRALKPALAVVRSLVEGYEGSPSFRADLEDAGRLCFALAGRARAVYDREKAADGFYDFTDLEVNALDRLLQPAARARLESELALVAVDEAQDTSPMQLAVFCELGALAGDSIWIGDSKQSIYGFRGTDPELLDDAWSTLADETETLPRCYRSRPALVRVTSALFSRAFARQGLKRDQVVLEPGVLEDPLGDAPVIARWRWSARRRHEDAAAIGRLVSGWLAAPPAVRGGGGPRPARASDLALLCRTNAACDRVADALVEVGVPVARGGRGLVRTYTARVFRALLAVIDRPGSAARLARLARVVDYPDEPERWLRFFVRYGAEAFTDDAPVARALASAARTRGRPLLERVDGALEAVDVAGVAALAGEGSRAASDVDALRALVIRFAEDRARAGLPASVGGLLSYLRDLEESGADRRAGDAGEAVTVTTWHGAKGLEWPVVVLSDLDYAPSLRALGVHTERASAASAVAPLEGRRIRYWPAPYHGATRRTPLLERAAEHEDAARAERGAREQELPAPLRRVDARARPADPRRARGRALDGRAGAPEPLRRAAPRRRRGPADLGRSRPRGPARRRAGRVVAASARGRTGSRAAPGGRIPPEVARAVRGLTARRGVARRRFRFAP